MLNYLDWLKRIDILTCHVTQDCFCKTSPQSEATLHVFVETVQDVTGDADWNPTPPENLFQNWKKNKDISSALKSSHTFASAAERWTSFLPETHNVLGKWDLCLCILRTFHILRTNQSTTSYQIPGPRLRLAREKLPRKKRRLSSGAERSNKEVLWKWPIHEWQQNVRHFFGKIFWILPKVCLRT